MSWKQVAALPLVFVILIIALSALTMPQESTSKPAPSPYSFSLFIQGSGAAESDNADYLRAYVDVEATSYSARNSTLELLAFGEPMRNGIYLVSDYPSGKEKKSALSALRSNLSFYGMSTEDLALADAMGKDGSVIILPSNAMPYSLASGSLTDLIDGNAVIYFGKSLGISIDKSGAQVPIGENLTELLNITYSDGKMIPRYGGPLRTEVGNATILDYGNGWLIIYPDSTDPGIGKEISDLILHEGWQSKRAKQAYSLTSDSNGSLTLFSPKISAKVLYPRLIYFSDSGNGTKQGVIDLKGVSRLNGTLRIPETINSNKSIPYSFELHDNLTYPMTYQLSLEFMQNGRKADTSRLGTLTIKTFALDSGSAEANLTSGSYLVNLVDQSGNVLARSYARVPQARIQLFMIDGYDHYFRFTVDGMPASSKNVMLNVNGGNNFTMHTDKNGEAKVSFGLAPGLYNFEADVGGEKAVAYYMKTDEGMGMYTYALLFFGSMGIMAFYLLRYKTKRKWLIKTYMRPSKGYKTIKIPYETFLDLFCRTQGERAKGLPLSVTDLRMGIRKHAQYKGSQVFITDSNIYRILDSLIKKKKFSSYAGYFMPASMLNGLPIEYWVLRRRLMDYSIENGLDVNASKDAEFCIRGKKIHIWGNISPKKLICPGKKSDSLIIFPDDSEKEKFLKLAARYDAPWMKVLLEIRHGRIYCQTMEQFLERGNNGKA